MRDLYNHITKEGDEIPINQMELGHLVNTAKVFIRNIDRYVKALNGTTVEMTPADIALYGRKSINYAEALRASHEALMPYLLELTIRGASGAVVHEIIEAYGRSANNLTIETTAQQSLPE